jgi:hypothetical protein
MFKCFFSRSSYLLYSGTEKAPADPAAREALWVKRSLDVQSNKICCSSFQMGFRYSDPRQYSRSPLRDLGVNPPIIIKKLVSRGATDRLPTPVFTENTLSSNYKNCFVCLGTNVKRTLSLEDKSWQDTIHVRTSSSQFSDVCVGF